MEKIQIKEELKNDYAKLVQSAQQIEASIGSAYCKLNKMVEVRRQIDSELKTWWDKVSAEHEIDKTKDYFVDQDGVINVVQRPEETVAGGEKDGRASKVTSEEGNQGSDTKGGPKEEQSPTAGAQEDVDNKEGGTTEDLV